MTTYTKNIITDFPNGLDTGLLHSEIENDGFTILKEITTHGDGNANIIFERSLESNELDSLNIIITNHTPIYIKHNIVEYIPQVQTISSTNYIQIGRFSLKHKTQRRSISGIDMISHIDNTISSCNIQFISRCKNIMIANMTFTNNTLNTNTTADILTDPFEDCIIDIIAKITFNGGKSTGKAYINEIRIWN